MSNQKLQQAIEAARAAQLRYDQTKEAYAQAAKEVQAANAEVGAAYLEMQASHDAEMNRSYYKSGSFSGFELKTSNFPPKAF